MEFTNFLNYESVQNGEPPSVKIAASLFQELCYGNKDSLMAGIIVAGWDKYKGGTVYSVPLGGSLHRQAYAIGGSNVFLLVLCVM
jgi:20S proteasome subunit beta 1